MPITTDVLVVGAGPVGSVLALELAHHGVTCTVIEQSTTASRHPKMDFVNARSMELLRRLGLADELRELGVPPDSPFNFQWTHGLADPPIAEWTHWSVTEFRDRMAATNDGSLPREAPQRVIGSRLEDLSRQRCRSADLVDLREGSAFAGLQQHADGVSVDVVDCASGRQEVIRARYVVACDGARSAVRHSAGMQVEEMGPVSQHCNVYFRSADPALVRHGRFFLTISSRGLTLVSRDGGSTWTGTFPLAPDEPLSPDPIRHVRDRLGIHFDVDEVISVARWENRLDVARTYRSGSVFLAGDAAHQFFPAGGHGANTGIADAVDLGWKLAAVLRGWGGEDLLDSYEAERRPVGLINREACFNLMEVWRRFMALARITSSPRVLAGYLEHQGYQIKNLGIHCGHRYADSPIVCPEDGPEPPWEWQQIVPTTWPGGRAPSVRLDDGTELFDLLGDEFTLVDCSGRGAGEPLVAEFRRAGVPITHLIVDDANVASTWERTLVLVRPDQHVAWRGNEVPGDVTAVLHQVTGRPSPVSAGRPQTS